MGCDGGTIPKRDELVRVKKKPEKKKRDDELAARWRHCALSQQLLSAPIVACELGRMYNKDSIIELLLDRSKFEDPTKVEHIKGLKDVKELALTKNPAYKADNDKAETYVTRACEFICPITGLEMTGRYKFRFIWTCGCAFSERALKEVKSVICNKCGSSYIGSDVITINAEEEELDAARTTMQERRAITKLLKKAKKKKAAEAEGSADGPSTSKKPKTEEATNGTEDKAATNDKDTQKEKKIKKEGKAIDKKFKSIQDNPNASKAYKSLFSSCKDAKSKGSAHWVTHNPFYN